MFAPLDEIEQELGPVEMTPAPSGVVSPLGIMMDVEPLIQNAVDRLGPDDFAALVGAATTDGKIQAVFVMSTASGWKPVLWFERKDGHNVGGVGVLKTWKR